MTIQASAPATWAEPPWARAITSTMARPSPAPGPVRAASPRLNGSKACAASSGGKPGPSSPRRGARPFRPPRAVPRRRFALGHGAARCRRGCRRPALRAVGRHGARGRPRHPSRSRRPASSARDRKRSAMPSRSSAAATGSRRTGSSPPSARASTSRSSASRESRSVSSAADRTRLVQLLRSALAAKGEVELCAEHRERRPQLVARIGDEAALSLECRLQTGEHRVQRLAEPAQLVFRRRQRQPPARLGRGHRLRLAPHRVDRPQRRGGEEVAAHRREQEGERPHDQQLRQQAAQRVLRILERDADREDATPCRPGSRAHGSRHVPA